MKLIKVPSTMLFLPYRSMNDFKLIRKKRRNGTFSLQENQTLGKS